MKLFTDLDGVYANGVACGIKKHKKDLAYIYVPNASGSAGVFTQNLCAASCVHHSRVAMKKNVVKAVVVNSGNANCYTGKQGDQDTKTMAKAAAKALNLRPAEVAVASTGIIGKNLPIQMMEQAILDLCAKGTDKDAIAAAEAILTVDLVTKLVYKTKRIGKKEIVVAGMSKGSGMIAPNMATTLSFLVTNATLNNDQCYSFLKSAIDDSLNMVTLDTDTSTNDMVLLFATGEKKFALNSKAETEAFQALMDEACVDLAKQMARDGEGASKLIEVRVNGATSKVDARTIAKNIVASPLVKTAVSAASANWGRLVMAIGKDPSVKVNPSKLDISVGDVALVKSGQPLEVAAKESEAAMKGDYVIITVDLNLSSKSATAWGCDLTNEFIRINAEYN